MVKSLNKIALVIAIIFALGCTSNDVIPHTPPNPRLSDNKVELRVNSVELFAWWGQGQKNYIKIEKWKDTSDPNIPHPQMFDVVCQLENVSDGAVQQGDFIAIVTIDFVVAPTYLENGDVNKIMTEVGWSHGAFDDFKTVVVPYIANREKSQIKIKDFNLEPVLKHLNGDGDTLWLWALRANVRLLNRDMVVVAKGQTIMTLMPSDKRLGIK